MPERIVYLITPQNENKRAKWRQIGNAFDCRDGSMNFRLDLYPGVVFNIRLPANNQEAHEAGHGQLIKDIPSELTLVKEVADVA